EEKFQTIKKLQGNLELFCYAKSIAPEKIVALQTQNIPLFCTEHYVMFAFTGEAQKKEVLEFIDPPKVIVSKNTKASDAKDFYLSPVSQVCLPKQTKEEPVTEEKVNVGNPKLANT